MAQSISGFAEAARVGLDIKVQDFTKTRDLIYKKMGFVEKSTNQAYLNVFEERDLTYLSRVNELEAHPEQVSEAANIRALYWYIYKSKLVLSKEKIDTDQTGIYKPGYVTDKLLDACQKTLEAIHANLFNNSFTSGSYALADGKAICATDHPLASGTQHNRGYYDGSSFSDASFSETAVENVITNCAQYLSHKGIMAPLMGPFRLITGPKNMIAAEKLMKTDQKIGSTNNDKNVARGMISDVVVHPMITTSSWWLLNEDGESPLVTLKRDDIMTWVEEDKDLTAVKIGANVRTAAHAKFWRNFHGTYVA